MEPYHGIRKMESARCNLQDAICTVESAGWNGRNPHDEARWNAQDGIRTMQVAQCNPTMRSHHAIPQCNLTMQSSRYEAISKVRSHEAICRLRSHDTICVNQSMNNLILQQVMSPVSRWSTLGRVRSVDYIFNQCSWPLITLPWSALLANSISRWPCPVRLPSACGCQYS